MYSLGVNLKSTAHTLIYVREHQVPLIDCLLEKEKRRRRKTTLPPGSCHALSTLILRVIDCQTVATLIHLSLTSFLPSSFSFLLSCTSSPSTSSIFFTSTSSPSSSSHSHSLTLFLLLSIVQPGRRRRHTSLRLR